MDKIIDVTGGQGGNAFLLVGEEKTALIDCGMAYCADKLISNVKQRLKNKTLDYILLSHSHYDHIGAIPYLKKEWPNSKVLGAEHAKRVLNKPSALKTIRQLSIQAAKVYQAGELEEYEDSLLKVDVVICNGSMLDLGGLQIKVIETQGHTQCSLSFLVDKTILFTSESSGCMSKSGKIQPAFITSVSQAIASIRLCQKINPRFIVSPHFGLVSPKKTPGYWEQSILAVQESKQIILDLAEQGYDEEQILMKYEKIFRDDHNKSEQPISAFRINTKNMIKTVLREKDYFLAIAN
ncbi:MAG: beta-lactamase domain protein [Firmicutes bacterium]|nr:beta-lactamase domain protein [Bacillota bacterium]